jgi:bifunctional UDP-N-acetylglucosamine pyrophosphorylase / glucosamine-1-phosphate N-acetyltransferase
VNEKKRHLQAIVLAGGKGTRMRSELPKVLHDLYGKSVIQHSIDNIREAGIDDVIVVVGYGRDRVMEHLHRARTPATDVPIDRSSFAVTG